MILHGIEYQRPTSLNMRILADHVTYSFLAFMRSIFHFCLGCYCGGYSQSGRSNLSSLLSILTSNTTFIIVYLNTPYVDSVGREVYGFQWYPENKLHMYSRPRWNNMEYINLCKQPTIIYRHSQFRVQCIFWSWWRNQMEYFTRYRPFVRGIHRSPVNYP